MSSKKRKKMTNKAKLQEKKKMCEIDDHIFKHFEIKRRLGKGAYGIVWKAVHKATKQTVAVKKIFDAFRDETDAQRTFREIMFLRAFREHPCIIQLHNVYRATNNLDIYLCFEFMESDLHNVIKKGNVLKDVHKRYIFYQLLNAINYIHSGNVIHRDLKPSNVLIDTKCNCKLADFGLARSVSNQQMRDAIDSSESLEPMLTDYVATRWYRAPEILVASKRYTKGIDMWSLGCILGEMIRGKPIFQGNSTVDQIEKIVSALPEVTEKDIVSVGAGFGSALLNKTISCKSNATTIDELLIDGTTDANDLVKRLLVLDPMARLTAVEALGHKYVEKFQDRIELIELNVDVKPPFHDDIRLSVNEYRSKLYEIIQQPDKSPADGRHHSHSHTHKREPRSNNKSTDVIPSNLNANDEKVKRTSYRSQERNACMSASYNDLVSMPKTMVQRVSNKIKTPSSQQKSVLYSTIHVNPPKSRIVTNFTKTEMPPSNSKCPVASSDQTSKHSRSTSKNSSSSPELAGNQRFQTKSIRASVGKRHSIDGSYVQCSNRLTCPQGNESSERGKSITLLPSHRNNQFIQTKTNIYSGKSTFSSSRHRTSYRNLSTNTDNERISPSNKNPATEEVTVLNEDSNFFKKNLKRLEEQIEKHKKEVKAFCSENSRYSKIIPANKRQSDSSIQQKITIKDKYFTHDNNNGTEKPIEFRSKVHSNTSGKCHSSERFGYLFDNLIDRRQSVVSKYGDKRPTKII